jgi:hypothetical protein
MHWNVDHCPIAMQLKKPAAVAAASWVLAAPAPDPDAGDWIPREQIGP